MADPIASPQYRCSAWALWLPRILGASVLASSLLAAFRFNSRESLGGWIDYLGPFVGLVGAATALWLVRRGGEVRRRFVPGPEALIVSQGRFEHHLRWQEVRELRWQAPFAARGCWLGALAILDRDGRMWRVPSVITDGPALLRAVLERSGRSDLRSWAEALNLDRRLGRGPLTVLCGYLTALAVVAAGWIFYAR